ncbi:glycogen phosphorylase [Saccharomycopsis crataegensis]|uniref:Alpha-1,4 glucan phosphorylase n=1 Tax=Saccharomycopsis crataegensis TaxID=43959 RepID=A0AAV5QRJ4_9ASCO|nr:glycogen phosphorylase [Saccharomycopsis crataegensis]
MTFTPVSQDESDAGLNDPRSLHKRRLTGFSIHEIKSIESQIPLESREIWKKFARKDIKTKEDFEKDFVNHVETSLARSMYNCDNLAAYQASSLAIRDKLIIKWNQTQQTQTMLDQKRVYYMSFEFLMGRAMDNAMINTGLRTPIKESVSELGFSLEDLIEEEPDISIGNGGLGRLAACYLDSFATLNYAAWGYGIRYEYGIFSQKIVNGYQVEYPDYWLTYSNPWEIVRTEIQYPVDFYGYVEEVPVYEGATEKKKVWVGGERVLALAYDFPVPGYGADANVNNLRLWSARPTHEFDFAKFNSGEYQNSVEAQQRAESITAVLYPNDNFDAGKELRLKQQYFWVAASLHDIIRRFKKSKRPWREFPDQVAIQLNDTHPTLCIPELQRVLVDLEGLSWDEAWKIVVRTVGYTNHTVMQEALEKWPLTIFQKLLPRHLEIIYDINFYFLQSVSKKFPGDNNLMTSVSIIEESNPKQVKMANLAVIGSHYVNGVAALHSDLIKLTIFKDLVKVFGGDKFGNVTNGITPRRWLKQANPKLAELISSKLGGDEYLSDLNLLKNLEKYLEDKEFKSKWQEVKTFNKTRLSKLVKDLTGYEIDPTFLFDIQVKRIHEYKRQQMNIFGVIYRYLQLKSCSPEERKKFQPKVSIFAGKAAPGYYMAKRIIKLINNVSQVLNNDPETREYLQCVFIPDYNVSKAEIIIPASDISEHISTAGTEASGTSNMKFVLNAGLLIGTLDGATVEIAREIGEENVFLFGHLSENVDKVRASHLFDVKLPSSLETVFQAIDGDVFGDSHEFKPLLDSIRHHSDFYIVSDDFNSYLEAQRLIDETFKGDHDIWIRKCITSVANMGFFSSDRAVEEYAEMIWNIEPLSK